MDHPTPEEWLEKIEGEASPELEARLTAHLEACPECRTQFGLWGETHRRLRGMDFPPQAEVAAPRRAWRPDWRIAAAAVVLLGLGVLLGRTTGPGSAVSVPTRRELTAAVQAEMGRSLPGVVEAVFARDLKAALTLPPEALTNGFQVALRQALDQTASEAAAAATRRLRSQMDQVAVALRAEAVQDQRATVARLDDLQSQTEAQFIGLRSDLESLATQADRRLRWTGRELQQMAANRHP